MPQNSHAGKANHADEGLRMVQEDLGERVATDVEPHPQAHRLHMAERSVLVNEACMCGVVKVVMCVIV